MTAALKLAVSQFPVAADITSNAAYIARHMKKAARENAHVVHFPECALSGYAGTDFPSFDGYDWALLDEHTQEICALAATLRIWVVLGSSRRCPGEDRPRNCIHVLSDSGVLEGSYDKRNLYKDDKIHYIAGDKPLLMDIHGITCGFLICNDSWKPALYEDYRTRGAHLLFHACYNAKSQSPRNSLDDLALAQIRTRASDHGLWISTSNSSARYSRYASCVARPDGSLHSAKRHVPGLIFHEAPQ